MEIYDGFSTVIALAAALKEKGLPETRFAVVRFKGVFYAVAFENFQKEIIFGANDVWYVNRDGYFSHKNLQDFRLPYHINFLAVKKFNDSVAKELLSFDPGASVLLYSTYAGKFVEVDREKHHCYLTLLGITFRDEFYTPDEFWLLKPYFKPEKLEKLKSFLVQTGAVSINPFRSQVRLPGGKVRKYRINGALSAVHF